MRFACLQGKDVIAAKVSDHHPVLHNGVLFWNIMMQGKKRAGSTNSYNNGFGITETDEQYRARLAKVASVIAEMIMLDPSVDVVNLCEGPVQPSHIQMLLQSLTLYDSMAKFFKDSINPNFHKPTMQQAPQWGLLMLAEKSYQVMEVQCDLIKQLKAPDKLANRFQLWALTKGDQQKYVGLGHFPFGGDPHIVIKEDLSLEASQYCILVNTLLKRFANDRFILSADFNLNPYLIGEYQDRAADNITHGNSILLNAKKDCMEMIEPVTVDGVLLSLHEKQRYTNLQSKPHLFFQTKRELDLYKSTSKEYTLRHQSFFKEHIIENRHKNETLQEVYDQQYGLVSYAS